MNIIYLVTAVIALVVLLECIFRRSSPCDCCQCTPPEGMEAKIGKANAECDAPDVPEE